MFSVFNICLMVTSGILLFSLCVMARGYTLLREDIRELRSELLKEDKQDEA